MKSLQKDVELSDPQGSSFNSLLNSMQPHYPALCAVWDLWDVLPVAPGDLGVMIPGDDPSRPRFRTIVNLAVKMNEWLSEQGQIQPVTKTYPEYAEQQYYPSYYWSSEAVDTTTTRHSLRLGSTPMPTAPKIVYSRARRISLLGESFNYHASWSYLRHLHESGELRAIALEHNIHPADLMLIFSTSESRGYTHLILRTAERRDALLAEVGAQNGVLYFFENLAAAEGELNGYWSAVEKPGNPLWGASSRSPGAAWGWEHSDGDFKVEIGRKGPLQHIRYVSL
ncbi:hypothetical protein B0H19DRAFT_316849 [Mycena capillaripes]|nr:hypothetical protein B0H19DRAFT_316849 [Mycena capillaripes]